MIKEQERKEFQISCAAKRKKEKKKEEKRRSHYWSKCNAAEGGGLTPKKLTEDARDHRLHMARFS